MNPGMKPYLDQIVPILKDLGDQPESEYLLIMNNMFIPCDGLDETDHRIIAYRKSRTEFQTVVEFSEHESGWVLMRRSDLILVPRTEIEEINAINAQRREELTKALHDTYHPKCDEAKSPYGPEPPLDPRAGQDPLWFRGQAL